VPFDYHSVQGGIGRIWIGRGDILGQELIVRNDYIFESKIYEGVRWLLIDQTANISIKISSEEVRIIKGQDDRLASVLPELVTAVVVPTNVSFGLTRMWELLTERPGWSVCAFRTRPEAEAWLRDEVRRRFNLELPPNLHP